MIFPAKLPARAVPGHAVERSGSPGNIAASDTGYIFACAGTDTKDSRASRLSTCDFTSLFCNARASDNANVKNLARWGCDVHRWAARARGRRHPGAVSRWAGRGRRGSGAWAAAGRGFGCRWARLGRESPRLTAKFCRNPNFRRKFYQLSGRLQPPHQL